MVLLLLQCRISNPRRGPSRIGVMRVQMHGMRGGPSVSALVLHLQQQQLLLMVVLLL